MVQLMADLGEPSMTTGGVSPVVGFGPSLWAGVNDRSMTKHDDHVHVPVMFTEYTEDTNPNNEFAELMHENTIEYDPALSEMGEVGSVLYK
jgi:hypothetical protein